MKKRVLIATLALVVSMGTTVFANPINNESRAKLDEVLSEIATMEANVQEVNYEVNNIEYSITKMATEIENSEKNIKDKQLELAKKEKEFEKQANEIREKAKSAYVNNVNDVQQYLGVLLNSANIKDFAQRFMTIKEIMSSNKTRLDKFNSDKEQLEKEQEELENEKVILDEMMATLEKEREGLKLKKSVQESKIADFTELKEQYEDEIEENEAIVAASVQNISEAIEEELATASYEYESSEEDNSDDAIIQEPIDNPSGTGSDLVSTAFKYLGVPYVWGGSSPSSGFDCSGFTQYVYREAGIDISRTTYTQITEGYAVTDLQPGDLVFFGPYSSPYHVGMYIGNGQYIHAPTEGDVVKVASLEYRGDFSGARRYR